MFSPEDQQIEICLLKSNLEEIENGLIVQHSALPALEVENELKYRETMSALRSVRALNSEIEQLKQESGITKTLLMEFRPKVVKVVSADNTVNNLQRANFRLTAKRMQLKRQCEDISRELERARSNRSDFENLLKQEERDIELEIRKYEEALREIADRFRKTRVTYNEHEIRAEIESVNKLNIDLEKEEKYRRSEVIELQRELDLMQASVPQNLLDIIGQSVLDEKLKALSMECDALKEKRDYLLNARKATPMPSK